MSSVVIVVSYDESSDSQKGGGNDGSEYGMCDGFWVSRWMGWSGGDSVRVSSFTGSPSS